MRTNQSKMAAFPMSSKNLATLAVVLAIVAAIFLHISQSIRSQTDDLATPPSPTNVPAAQPTTASPATAPAGQASVPAKPAAPDGSVVLKSGDKFTTPSGLQVEILVAGDGAEAVPGNPVTVNYTGTFANGTVFDTNLKAGRTPFTFLLGGHQVIAGWDEGVAGMKIGEKRKLVIPSKLAYGPTGKGPIRPNTDLTFEVELLKAN